MSIAPLSARQFRFLTLVAFAPFLLLTLVMASAPAYAANVTSTCHSLSPPNHSTLPLNLCAAGQQLADNASCCACFDPAYDTCVTQWDCSELMLNDSEKGQACFDQCYNGAQHNCGCACNH